LINLLQMGGDLSKDVHEETVEEMEKQKVVKLMRLQAEKSNCF